MPNSKVLQVLRESVDVVVLPSQKDDAGCQEGLPISLCEAASLGLPSIASRCGGIGELIIDGTTGLLVNQRDLNALMEAMIYLANHPQARECLGTAARDHVRNSFNAWHQMDDIADLYKDAIDDSAH